jgi:pimeloyl-ACP methyl ester carboxylesterase
MQEITMPNKAFRSNVASHRVASASGTLFARVIRPERLLHPTPLVVLHGISRNAAELVTLFRPEAERNGRQIVIPHFTEARWPTFQRPGQSARPDQALLALLSHLAVVDPAFAGYVDLFGHSGGAQLAHRFAMLYPHRVRKLNLAAAGWYCLPDTSMAYPYGLAADATPSSLSWARRHEQALPCYLGLGVRVFVGTQDTLRDESLRVGPELDRVQGRNRVIRAENFVERFRAAAQMRGIMPDIGLVRLPGVTHDVAQAIAKADLARLVTQEADVPLAKAC